MYTKPQLEQHARELERRGAGDRAALAELCAVYWLLNEKEAAYTTFQALLRHEEPAPDPAFDAIYLEALRATSTCPVPAGRRKRFFNLAGLLERTANVRGEIVECGCYLGLSSYVMCSYLKRRDGAFDGSGYHIFDSFQGLSEPTEEDDIPDGWTNAQALRATNQRGHFAVSLETVAANLRAFPRIRFHPGWIPATFEDLPEASYRFVHVDVDLYDPTYDSFEYFYPRLAPGGAIVSDDYNWPGARQAIDEFCAVQGVEAQVTSSNQAVIWKT